MAALEAQMRQAMAREEELLKQKAELHQGLNEKMNAQIAEAVAQERISLETSLKNKKLALSEEVEIRKKATAEAVKAMAAQGPVTKGTLEAIVAVTGESDRLGKSQIEVAKAAVLASVGMAKERVQAAACYYQ